MSTEEFLEALGGLSNVQKETVLTDRLPLLVLAGPGSGKTRVLTCRIASILNETRGKKFRVLGLTFTNKAADEMRSRVAVLMPEEQNRLFLGTFHSFCADVLRQHGTHLGINPNYNIYSQKRDLEAVLNDAVETAKKTSGLIRNLDKKLLPVIQRLKARLIFPENCMGEFQDASIGERVAIVYPAYEAELAKRNALDFNSLILKTYQLFEKFPAFAKRYRTVYPYICIDEFQDTNRAQYSLIRALVQDQNRNLFVVADDDQIIYQWNGAGHKRIMQFMDDFSPKVVQLPMNYRCPPEIVALANNLIQYNFHRANGKKPLEAFKPALGEEAVHLFSAYPNYDSEANGIAADIKNLHSGQLDSVVVLGRNRRLLEGVERSLKRAKISAVISQRKDEFTSSPLVWLHSVLRLANDRQNKDYLEAVCGAFAQLTHVNVDPEDVITEARAGNRDYMQHWIKLIRKKPITFQAREAIDNVAQCLGEGRDYRGFSRFALEWFGKLIQNSGTLGHDPIEEEFSRYEEERAVWEELAREITSSLGGETTLEAFLQELEMHSKESSPRPNTVVLMTIHGAKGKEFDHVYLIGLVDDELPSFQSKKKGSDSPEMEEERRNCFVAITRSMKTLTLSYAENYKRWPKKPSRFLFEMGLLKE